MRDLVLRMSLTLDGFVCGPTGEMDWLLKTRSADGAAWAAEKTAQAGTHLLGRKTFETMSAFWPTATDVFAAPMNEIPKIVFSKKGFDPGATLAVSTEATAKSWRDAKVCSGDLTQELRALKKQDGKILLAHGGASFAQALIQTGLVDEFWFLRHPVAIGQGIGLFANLHDPVTLKLNETKTFDSGTVAMIYRA